MDERFEEACVRFDLTLLVEYISANTSDPETVRMINEFYEYQDARESGEE